MSDPDRAFEDLMNMMLYRIHQYNTILKVCVVIVSEGPVYTNIQNIKINTALTPLLNNILVMSWQSVSLVEETRVIGESHNSLTNFII